MRIILNPVARSGTGGRVRVEIERALERRGITFDLVQTEGPGHATELARAATETGIERIVAAGGDGTVHEVVNGILTAARGGAALGLIPTGTGNDFVKMVPGTSTREQALQTLANGRVRAYDVGHARWNGGAEYFINAMGTGIDVEVVRAMPRVRYLPGGVRYVAALLRALARYRPLPVRIDVDGELIAERIMLLAVANGTCVGGTFQICPGARADDGLLDVCLVAELPLPRIIRTALRVIRGAHEGQPGVTSRRGHVVRMSIAADRPLFFQLDGELREARDGRHGVEVTLEVARMNVITSGMADATAAPGVR